MSSNSFIGLKSIIAANKRCFWCIISSCQRQLITLVYLIPVIRESPSMITCAVGLPSPRACRKSVSAKKQFNYKNKSLPRKEKRPSNNSSRPEHKSLPSRPPKLRLKLPQHLTALFQKPPLLLILSLAGANSSRADHLKLNVKPFRHF